MGCPYCACKLNKQDLEQALQNYASLQDIQPIIQSLDSKSSLEQIEKIAQILEVKVDRADFTILINSVQNKVESSDFDNFRDTIQDMKQALEHKYSDLLSKLEAVKHESEEYKSHQSRSLDKLSSTLSKKNGDTEQLQQQMNQFR